VTRPPATLRWGVILLAIETVGLFAVLAALIYGDISGRAGTLRGAVTVTVFTALLAASFGGLAWALWRRRAWARGPAIVLQLLLVPLGSGMIRGLGVFGLLVTAFGLVGAGLLLAPSTRSELLAGPAAD
jgi:hypothetical protein